MAKNIKNKFLEDIGIPREEVATNFCNDDDDPRQKRWARQRRNYGFDDRETWSLDYTYIQWLYSHLMMYKKVTNVALEKDKLYNVCVAKDKVIEEISMKDALDFMLEQMKKGLKKDFCEEDDPEFFEALHMFADTIHAWWW